MKFSSFWFEQITLPDQNVIRKYGTQIENVVLWPHAPIRRACGQTVELSIALDEVPALPTRLRRPPCRWRVRQAALLAQSEHPPGP